MLKSSVMKQELDVLKNSAKVLIDNKEAKVEDITALDTEIETLQAKITMQEGIEADEVAELEAKNSIVLTGGKGKSKGGKEPVDKLVFAKAII